MTARLAEWGFAGRPLAGESESGDRALALEDGDGLLLAVIDGLGHGPEASHAAEVAAGVVRDGRAQPLEGLVRECHEALRATRGVVMALAAIRPERSEWIGIGNIEGRIIRPGLEPLSPVLLPQLGGILGYELPPLRATTLSLVPYDVLILATDGLRPDFKPKIRSARPVQEIADELLADLGRPSDDAMVLVARYLGEAP